MTPCPCDARVHPPVLKIPSGLDRIPRQIAGFPEFRSAMLVALRNQSALAEWRARDDEDLGIMLLEMWAYVCDVQAFYDEVIAHESYQRTSRRRSSIRKLVGLLGYLPRPAVAASVNLAAMAEGRKPITLPVGTAFRSGAFNGEPPQVFELENDVTIHPLSNRWPLEPPRPTVLEKEIPLSLLVLPATLPAIGDPVLIRNVFPNTQTHIRCTARVEPYTGEDGQNYTQLEFTAHTKLTSGTPLDRIRLTTPTQTAALWTIEPSPDSSSSCPDTSNTSLPAIESDEKETRLTLDGLYPQIKPGDDVLISHGPEYRWFTIRQVDQVSRPTTSSETITINGSTFCTPGLKVPVTRLLLDVALNDKKRRAQATATTHELIHDSLAGAIPTTQTQFPESMDPNLFPNIPGGGDYGVDPRVLLDPLTQNQPPSVSPMPNGADREASQFLEWTDENRSDILVHYSFVDVGAVVAEARTSLSASDALILQGSEELPGDDLSPASFSLEDKNQQGVEVGGSVDFTVGVLALDPGTNWDPPLLVPVTVYGNVVQATRGEMVEGEVLGSGDASQMNQSFTLKKKPLTYTAAPTVGNESGVANSLRVYVEGVRWEEVPSFFYVKDRPEAQVYIVRQNDDGESIISFGDGRCGARLPTGVDNVIAYYRFGAGAASPPAGSITQLARPVKGLQRVRNPVAAFGGADPESAESLRTHASASALLLGRAVSIQDMEAAAAAVAGVRAVKAEWRWHAHRQRPVAQIWYVGDQGLEATVSQRLRGLTDPSTPTNVERAQDIPLYLSIAIEINKRYLEADVLNAVRAALMDRETGLLAPERIGIGRPLFRSRIFEEVLAVPGTVTVHDLIYNHQPFAASAITPEEAGRYFDLERGALMLTGMEGYDV